MSLSRSAGSSEQHAVDELVAMSVDMKMSRRRLTVRLPQVLITKYRFFTASPGKSESDGGLLNCQKVIEEDFVLDAHRERGNKSALALGVQLDIGLRGRSKRTESPAPGLYHGVVKGLSVALHSPLQCLQELIAELFGSFLQSFTAAACVHLRQRGREGDQWIRSSPKSSHNH